MANKFLLNFVLLLCLEAIIMMSVSGESDPQSNKDDSIFLGKFNCTDLMAPDFEQFLKAMEYSAEDCEYIRNSAVIYLRIRKEINDLGHPPYVLAIQAKLKNSYAYFSLGKEFTSKRLDRRPYQGTITFEGNKLIIKEKHPNFTCNHVGTFAEEGVKMSLECNGVKATLEYKRHSA